MGTRGTYGFRHNGTDYLTYNHFDSYPTGLGDEIVSDLKEYLGSGKHTLDDLRTAVANMTVVTDSQAEPSEAEKVRFKHLWREVDTGKNWYAYLRDLQGGLMGHIREGVMIVDNKFIMDSLFCEWGYIVNLDTGELEVYQGFQDTLHELGRYGGEVPDPEPYPSGHTRDKYYGCALVGTWPLTDLPENFGSMVEKLTDPEENEEAA